MFFLIGKDLDVKLHGGYDVAIALTEAGNFPENFIYNNDVVNSWIDCNQK